MSKDEDSHFVSSKAASEHHASRGSLLPMDVVDPAAKQRVAQAAEGAEDDDGNMASPERSASASTDYEKRSRDSTSLSLDDDGHSRTGGNNSSARPSLDCGLANAGGEGGECSSTSTVLYSYDGNQSVSYSNSASDGAYSGDEDGECSSSSTVLYFDEGNKSDSYRDSTSDCDLANAEGENGECSESSTVLYSYDGNQSDSAATAEDTRFPVARADKAVQCDMFSLEWAQQIHREAMQRIEDLKSRIRYYDTLQE